MDAGKAFERAFGGIRPRLEAAVKGVWAGLRRPWQVVYIAWDEVPGAIVGDGRPCAFLRGTVPLRGTSPSVAATHCAVPDASRRMTKVVVANVRSRWTQPPK